MKCQIRECFGNSNGGNDTLHTHLKHRLDRIETTEDWDEIMATGILKIPGRGVYEATSIAAASALYSELREASQEGNSTFHSGVFTIAGEDYRISYNGKVWAGTQPWKSMDVPVYNPYEATH